jgi:hypothetical protein
VTTKIKIERRTVEGLLSSIVGGAAVSAFTQHSWVLGALAIVAGAALFITEKADIEEEEA